MRALRAASIAVGVLLVAVSCGQSPEAPGRTPDLTGHWSGFINIPTWPLATPLEMDLSDANGTLSGAGGGVDCRYYGTCGYFYSYTVTGSHDARRVTIRGVTPESLSWVLSGNVSADGLAMSGFGEGVTSEFPRSSFQMQKKPQ